MPPGFIVSLLRMDINYFEFKPADHLAPYVECYWLHTFSGDAGIDSPVQCCLPIGMLEVIMHTDDNVADILIDEEWQPLPQSLFHGMYSTPVQWKVKSPARLFGICFKPEMFHHLFDVPAASLFCNFTDLGKFLGEEALALPESIHGLPKAEDMVAQVNLFLSQRLTQMKKQRNYVVEAASLIRSNKGNISVEEVSEAVHVSIRQLQRSFKEQLGTSPKGYLRIIRFRNALASLRKNDIDWGDITHGLGYADQAHLIREFRQFAGESPNAVIKKSEHYHKKPFSP